MNLTNATVTGYFSIPSASLAEVNPTAYTLAMASAPAGSGTCANCGMGIRHHVVIRLEDGQEVFIGCDCASRVGEELIARAVKLRKTTEQLAVLESVREANMAEIARRDALEQTRIAERREKFSDVLACLNGSDFHRSLAAQIVCRALSERQALFAVKACFVTGRRNKSNAAQWDAMIDSLTAE